MGRLELLLNLLQLDDPRSIGYAFDVYQIVVANFPEKEEKDDLFLLVDLTYLEEKLDVVEQ